MRVKLVVDSTADMKPEVAERVRIVPLTVHFGEKEFVSGVDIDPKRFYELLDAVETVAYMDEDVWDIVIAEAQAMFSGDRSLEETARNIQSKVSILVAEKS